MALIICPDCKKQISDRADRCPHCGLPAQYFHGQKAEQPAPAADNSNLDYANLGNILLSFDKDYCTLFGAAHYITHREEDHMNSLVTISTLTLPPPHFRISERIFKNLSRTP